MGNPHPSDASKLSYQRGLNCIFFLAQNVSPAKNKEERKKQNIQFKGGFI